MLPTASADYYRDQQKVLGVVLTEAQRIWGSQAPADFDAWFDSRVADLVALATAGQRRAASGAEQYTSDVLEELGTPVASVAEIATAGLVGVASDGRPLDSLMYGAVISAKSAIAQSEAPESYATSQQAWMEQGLHALLVRMQVQVADAARVANGLAIATRPDVGYVRMINPPACSRCTLLAGRHYKWNDGFDRHPQCDCRHIPSREDTADSLTTDPAQYFRSLSAGKQDKIFTKTGAQAIRDGADINQVVNARRGMSTAQQNIAGWIPQGRLTTRNVYGQRIETTDEGVTRRGIAYEAMSKAGYAQRSTDVRANRRNFQAKAPRLMPESIYKIAENRDDALRLLRLNGYITDRTARSSSATSSQAQKVTPTPEKIATASGGGIPPLKPPPGGGATASGGDDESVRRIVERAAKAEPAITSAVSGAVARAGGRLERLDTRLKSPQSIADKLERSASRNVARGLPADYLTDAVRYTVVLSENDYWSGGNRILASIAEAGADVIDDVGGWRRRGYRGRNVIARSSDGQMFEVQLHTAESLSAAERAHAVYEMERAPGVGSAQRKRYKREQQEIFDAVPWPKGVPEL